MQTKQKKYKINSIKKFCILAAGVLAVELTGISFLNKPYGITIATAIHLLLVVSLYFWMRQSYKKRGGRLQILLLILTAATGPFGAAICIVSTIGYIFFSPVAMHPNDRVRRFLSERQENKNLQLDERIKLGMENLSEISDVEPFRDILKYGTITSKQNVISKMTRYYRPQFVPVLLQAVQDSNPAVRVHAAAALAKIERHFMTEYISLEKSLKNIPNHDKARLQLAQVYEDYAQTGLIDEENIKMLRMKAIDIYEDYLAVNDCPEVKLRLAYLYLHQDEAEKALNLLGDTIATEKVTRNILVLLYMEALFRLNKFSEIRLVAKHYGKELTIAGNDNHRTEFEGTMCAWIPAIESVNVIKPVLEKSYAT